MSNADRERRAERGGGRRAMPQGPDLFFDGATAALSRLLERGKVKPAALADLLGTGGSDDGCEDFAAWLVTKQGARAGQAPQAVRPAARPGGRESVKKSLTRESERASEGPHSAGLAFFTVARGLISACRLRTS